MDSAGASAPGSMSPASGRNSPEKAFADSIVQALNRIPYRSVSPDSNFRLKTPPDTKTVLKKVGRIVRVLGPGPAPKSSLSNKISKAPRPSKQSALAKNLLQQPLRYSTRQQNRKEVLRGKDTVWEGRLRSRASHRGA